MNTTRATKLADQLDSLNNDLRAFVQQCDDDKWRALLPNENWPVNVAVHHILTGHYAMFGLIKRKMRSQPLPELTQEFIDGSNAAQAEGAIEVTQADILAMIDKFAVGSADFLRTLSDDQLNETIYFGPAGGDLAIGKIINLSLVHSAREHFDNILKAVNGAQ